jgi:hypothetical protein
MRQPLIQREQRARGQIERPPFGPHTDVARDDVDRNSRYGAAMGLGWGRRCSFATSDIVNLLLLPGVFARLARRRAAERASCVNPR